MQSGSHIYILHEHGELLYEWTLRLLLRSGSIDSFNVIAAEVDNKCGIGKDLLSVRGRAASGETLSRLKVRANGSVTVS